MSLLVLLSTGCPSTKTNDGSQKEPETGKENPFDLGDPNTKSKGASTGQTDQRTSNAVNHIRLKQVQAELGVEHTYENGEQGQALLVETIGGGCGWLDYDNDGWPDLYINQGGDPTSHELSQQPGDVFYRNRDGAAMDNVAEFAGLEERGYSQGVAVGDFDNDGFDDIYVTNVGENTLWWNCGDGTFLQVTDPSGTSDPRWGASAAWADLDRDGDLDLYVCNYCVFDPHNPRDCRDPQGRPTPCNPSELAAWPDACFINQGDGTFIDESKERGLVGDGNRALGVAVADFDNDGWPDVYVANDTTENFLFMNQGDGTFVDEAGLRGCAVDRAGGPQGSMGLAVFDIDGNGFLDIYSTHYYEESNTLYANFGDLGFRDITATAGLHRPTLNSLAFGTVMVDFDHDQRLDLLIANGHIDNSARATDPRMKPQLFTQGASGRWELLGDESGDYFSRELMGRGVALADFDRDGDADVSVVNENDESVILRNDSATQNWLQLTFCGTASNRRGVGCRVTVKAGENSYLQELCGGTSFAVSHEPRLFFGLGDYEGELQIEVHWPSGKTQSFSSALNQAIQVTETD